MLVAHTAFLAGVIAGRIWHAGATLLSFKMEIVGCLFVLMVVVLGPLSFFALHLDDAGRIAGREYGILASRYVEDFHRKWVEHREEDSSSLLGTADIQSLADLGNAFSLISRIRLFPFDNDVILRLAFRLVLPLLPLALTVVPVTRIIDWLIKLVV